MVSVSFPQLKIGLRVSWKCRNLCSRRWLRPNLSLVINLIPLGLWQLKIEFEDSLINFKILFLKVEMVLEFLIIQIQVIPFSDNWWKKRIYKKILFTTEKGTLIISSCIICFANARSILKSYSGDWPLNILKK